MNHVGWFTGTPPSMEVSDQSTRMDAPTTDPPTRPNMPIRKKNLATFDNPCVDFTLCPFRATA